MVNRENRPRSGRRFLVAAVVLSLVWPLIGCSTDVIPTAPTPKSRRIPIERDVPVDRLLSDYSRDFKDAYRAEAPWTNYMLVYLSVRFLARGGLERFKELPSEEQSTYPGVQAFEQKLEEYKSPWSYPAYLALHTLNRSRDRESFRSEINFQPFQNFAVGKWLKTRIASDQPLPDFNAKAVKPEFRDPLLKASALILAAQYYLQSYQSVTEPTVLDEHFRTDIRWLLKQWRRNYLRVRTIWPQRFDLAMLSSHTLSPLYEPAEEDPVSTYGRVNPTDRRFGRSTLPFRDIYDVSMENIPPRIRDVQTKAIEEYIEGRLHSSLRLWLQALTYAMKYRIVEQFTDQWSDQESKVGFYARNALEDINNVMQIN